MARPSKHRSFSPLVLVLNSFGARECSVGKRLSLDAIRCQLWRTGRLITKVAPAPGLLWTATDPP
jgi:hypothetical protein